MSSEHPNVCFVFLKQLNCIFSMLLSFLVAMHCVGIVFSMKRHRLGTTPFARGYVIFEIVAMLKFFDTFVLILIYFCS